MKKVVALFVGLLFTANIGVAQNGDNANQLSEPVETGENYEVYGSEFLGEVRFFAPGYLVRNADVFKGQEVATRGTIKQVCQKKGCFFMLSAGEQNIRITFKDYSFFVPKNSAGSRVHLVGRFRTKALPENEAKHYAEDAGENAEKVKGAQKEYNIVATSVKIMDVE